MTSHRPAERADLQARSHTALFAAFLVATGACSLVYEVTWARELILYLGNTSMSHAAVLTAFMAGQGIGYLWLGRRAASSANPLRMYAMLEAGIVVLAVFARFVLPELGAVVNRVIPSDSAGSMALRGALASLALMPATILMGGTLPALVRATRRDYDSAAVARLYAANSLGAVLGCVVSGYVLLAWLGLDATAAAAWALNTIIAGIAWTLSRKNPPSEGRTHGKRPGPSKPWSRPVLMAAIAIVGAASMVIQTASLRLFGVVMGSSTYSFSAVVAAFILAIVAGSEWARWQLGRPHEDRGRRIERWLVATPAVAALSLMAVCQFGERTPWLLAHIRAGVGDTFVDWVLFEAAKLGFVAVGLFVPVASAAAFLPLAIARHVDDGLTNTRAAARSLAVNTVGASLGAALGGTLLLPACGLDNTFTVAALLLAMAAVFASVDRSPRLPQRHATVLRGIAAGAVIVAILVRPDWDPRMLSASAFRWRNTTVPTWQRFENRLKRDELRFASDGPDATAIVTARDGGITLKVNGKPDASTHGDMLTQVASAHVPLLLAKQRKRVLIIGLGSGVTAASAALHGAAIDVIEISEAVAGAASHFAGANRNALELTNVRLHIDDARAWLARRDDRFDVIISEPSNPWVAGNAALFSREFFELARSRLAPGGVLAQWFHAYEMTDELLLAVLGTARGVFDELRVFVLHQGDVLSIARAAGAPNTAHNEGVTSIRERYTAEIAADLARVDVPDLAALLSLEALPPPQVRAVIPVASPALSDRHPVLEYRAPRALFAGARASAVTRHDARTWPPAGTGLLIDKLNDAAPIRIEQLRAIYKLHTRFRGAPPRFRRSLVPHLLKAKADDFTVDLLFTLVRERHLEQADVVAETLARDRADDPRALFARALLNLERRRSDKARALLRRCAILGDTSGRCARKIGAL